MLLSLADGTIQDLNMSTGSQIKKGEVVATIISPTGKPVNVYAPYTATVEGLSVKEGQQVKVNDGLAKLAYKRISDINNIPYLPESQNNEKFELFAGKINKSNVIVDVFEAVDTKPVNPVRRKNKNEKALRVGSRTEVSVSGNWE
jgi:pyruvate/2-oxoglutarate dehydrogenase complex dihydrolipoamide acyltransferase (E2) component